MFRRLDAGANSLAANADKMMLADLADILLGDGISAVHNETAEKAIVKRVDDVRVEKNSADLEPMCRLLVNTDRVSSRQLQMVIKGLVPTRNSRSGRQWYVTPLPMRILLSHYSPTTSCELRCRTTSPLM